MNYITIGQYWQDDCRLCLKTWGWASNVSTVLYVIFQYAPFLACRYGNTNTCCLQFELGKGKIWALRRGLVCGRHVCFVFTHTQTCQMNNAFLPPPSCSDQSCIGVTRTRFLVSFSTGSLIIGDEDGKLLSCVGIFFYTFWYNLLLALLVQEPGHHCLMLCCSNFKQNSCHTSEIQKKNKICGLRERSFYF